jgi:ribonuclease-3
MTDKIKSLEQFIGTKFKDEVLLHTAMTHPSITYEEPDKYLESNQRLEFLGDALIGLVAAHEIYINLPDVTEGELTELRSAVVRREALARVAKDMNLGEYLKLGQGEEKGGGKLRASNLAAGLEALVGAILIDQGMTIAWDITVRLLEKELKKGFDEGIVKDPKSILQELTQRIHKGLPEYQVIKESGPEHERNFSIQVIVDKQAMGSGTGNRKIDAERAAAREAIMKIVEMT